MNSRSSRQSFLGDDSDEILRQTTIAIIGTSGGGSPVAQQLAHIGVGKVYLIDPAIAQEHHRHRLIGVNAICIRAGWPKVKVVKRLMDDVHPEGVVVEHPVAWQEVHEILRECDLVFSCVDGYAARDEIERYLRRFNIPLIDLGMDVNKFEAGYQICGQVILSLPGSHCMRCFGYIKDELLSKEVGKYGDAGVRAQVSWANSMLANAAVGMAISYLLPWHSTVRPEPYLEYDGNLMIVKPSGRLLYLRGTECSHYKSLSTSKAESSPRRRRLTTTSSEND